MNNPPTYYGLPWHGQTFELEANTIQPHTSCLVSFCNYVVHVARPKFKQQIPESKSAESAKFLDGRDIMFGS